MRQGRPRRPTQRRRLRLILVPLGVGLAATIAWIVWTENHPEQERELRLTAQERLEEWFPEEMSLPPEDYGFIPRSAERLRSGRPQVLLVHGLDEPGGIWDDLVPALDDAGIEAWEFRYPSNQAVDDSADLLATHWMELEGARAVVLIGHSMGGLVIRDFVTRLLYPTPERPAVEGVAVRGVIMVGTPNQGSEWARLRVWLGLRDLIVNLPQQEFSLFAELRDGTGAAKIDLRPGSRFLTELNAREWPDEMPVRLIGGRLTEATPAMLDNLETLSHIAPEMVESAEDWMSEMSEGLGDGVVPLASLSMPEAPPPVVVSGSHRGMLVRTPFSEEESVPPAIPEILSILEEWLGSEPSYAR